MKKFLMGPLMFALGLFVAAPIQAAELAYLTPGLDVPFWRYMSKGITDEAEKAGHTVTTYDSGNDAAKQLSNVQDAIARKVGGIIISPTDSSTAPKVLQLAEQAGIPVVVSDIGTDSGTYVSFILSDNFDGAYNVGKAAAAAFAAANIEKPKFAQVTISLARANGQKRTEGWRKAMKEANGEEVDLKQMQLYTTDESFKFVQDMLTANPDINAFFLQSDTPSMGAVRAVQTSRMTGKVMLFGFDGIPEFIDCLKQGKLMAAGMQQPYLMGSEAAKVMSLHLKGEPVEKEIMVPIVLVTKANVDELLPTIKMTVFGGELK